jgi:hypothetical protein
MKYKLVPGTCEVCCFRKGAHGVILCDRRENTECTPGITCYTEVPSTNGDRIRAMSNEELAHFIDKRTGCPPENGTWHCAPESCQKCWLNWLNSEAKTETEGETEA